MHFHDTDAKLIASHDDLAIQRVQEIPQEYIDGLRQARAESANRRMGEFERVASIPVAVYEHWLRQGYDVQKEPIAKTLAKLKAEGLDYFITTEKTL
jgi:hypothetical protein